MYGAINKGDTMSNYPTKYARMFDRFVREGFDREQASELVVEQKLMDGCDDLETMRYATSEERKKKPSVRRKTD